MLPYPPSVNRYWRNVVIRGSARVLISKQGREYREGVSRILFAETRGRVKFLGPVTVDAVAFPPDRRERDLDNLPKSVFDSLQAAGLLERDSQICDFRFRRGPVVKGGGLMLRIAPAKAPICEDYPHEPTGQIAL